MSAMCNNLQYFIVKLVMLPYPIAPSQLALCKQIIQESEEGFSCGIRNPESWAVLFKDGLR